MIRRIVIPSDGYPLSWPLGVPRTEHPKSSRYQPTTYHREVRDLRDELARIGASTIVVSSNLAGDTVRNKDHGVAVYWTAPSDEPGASGNLEPHVMTCDAWQRVEHNVHAITLSLENIRALDRHGAVRREQAYAGFRALPPAPGEVVVRPWRDVLGIPADGWGATAPNEVILAFVKTRHRALMNEQHPDRGGDHVLAAEIGVAYEQALVDLAEPNPGV